MYSFKAVANYFLDKGDKDGIEISPMKLIKLVYIAHGWFLALKDKPLLEDYVHAWDYGPVIPDLYHEFKEYGSKPIYTRAIALKNDSVYKPNVSDKQDKRFLNSVWKAYKRFDALKLSAMTHVEGSPWHTVRYKLSPEESNRKYPIIPDDEIKAYYKKLMDDIDE